MKVIVVVTEADPEKVTTIHQGKLDVALRDYEGFHPSQVVTTASPGNRITIINIPQIIVTTTVVF